MHFNVNCQTRLYWSSLFFVPYLIVRYLWFINFEEQTFLSFCLSLSCISLTFVWYRILFYFSISSHILSTAWQIFISSFCCDVIHTQRAYFLFSCSNVIRWSSLYLCCSFWQWKWWVVLFFFFFFFFPIFLSNEI